MAAKGFQPAPLLPRWVVLTVSAVVGFHLFALGIVVLAAQNGPWWVEQMGRNLTSPGPQFAGAFNEWTAPYYLHPLGLAQDGHYESNRTLFSTVQVKVHLTKDEDGQETVLTFPDPKANMWVRHRQSILIQRFGDDQPHMLNQDPSVRITAPEGKADMAFFLFPTNPNDPDSDLIFYETPQFEFKRVKEKYREFPFFGPSESSMILMTSFIRHLQHEHGAAKVEVVRQSRNPRFPMLMMQRDPTVPDKLFVDDPTPLGLPPQYLKTMTVRFGDGQPKEWRDQ